MDETKRHPRSVLLAAMALATAAMPAGMANALGMVEVSARNPRRAPPDPTDIDRLLKAEAKRQRKAAQRLGRR